MAPQARPLWSKLLLVATGSIPTAGSVAKGNTVCDFDPLERGKRPFAEFGHRPDGASGRSSSCGRYTPGYPDFAGPAIAALAGVDTALIVINAQTGIELMSERMMRHAADASCAG